MAVEGTGTPKRLFWGEPFKPYQAVKGIESGTLRRLTVKPAPGLVVAFQGGLESDYD